MPKEVSPGVLALRKVVDDVYADARIRRRRRAENARESRRVIRAAADSFVRGGSTGEPYAVFTRGHMKRGVE